MIYCEDCEKIFENCMSKDFDYNPDEHIRYIPKNRYAFDPTLCMNCYRKIKFIN